MRFPIPVRNAKSGLEKQFFDKQEIADFLATQETPEDWEGFAHLGELPKPTAAEVVEEPVEVVEPGDDQQLAGDPVESSAPEAAPTKTTKPVAPAKRATKKAGK